MDPKQAAAAGDQAVLLDVREPHEWDAGHIEGSVHMPMMQLASRRQELPEDRLIVCVCRSGQRSAMVAAALARAGFDTENLDGGVLAWVEDRRPLLAADGGAGRVV